MNHLTYLLSVIVFCGIPFLVMWRKQERVLKRYELVILIMVVLGVLFSTTDYFAVHWGAWYYNPQHTLDVNFITEVETFGFGAGIFLCVASATVISAGIVDRLARAKQRKKRKTK